MKKKSITLNYIYNMLYQLLAIFLPIITIPYLSRVLGSENVGIFSYTNSYVAYLLLIGSLGVNLYGQREIAMCQNDSAKMNLVFKELFCIKLFCTFFVSIIYVLIFCISGEYVLFYRILLIEFLANSLDICWFYQGIEEFKKVATRNFAVKIISLLLIFILVKSPSDLWKYFLIYCCSNLIGSFSLWINLKKYNLNFNKTKFTSLKHMIPILQLFIPQVAIQIYAVVDKIMIGSILGDMNEVGYYESAQKVVRILMTLITSLGVVMLPRIASCFANNKDSEIKLYIEKSFKMIFCIGFPMMFGIIAISKDFVPFFFGKGFDAVILLICIMALIIIPVGISDITGNSILIAQKKQKEYTISVVVGAIVNMVLNFILISIYGTIGAVIATVISESIISIIQLYYCRKNLKNINLFLCSKNYFIASCLMFGICFLITFINIKSKIMLLALKVLSGFFSYIIILFIIKDDFFVSQLNKFKKIFKIKEKIK